MAEVYIVDCRADRTSDDVVNLIVPVPPQDWFVLASQEPLENDLAGSLLVARYQVLVKHGDVSKSMPYALELLRRGMYC